MALNGVCIQVNNPYSRYIKQVLNFPFFARATSYGYVQFGYKITDAQGNYQGVFWGEIKWLNTDSNLVQPERHAPDLYLVNIKPGLTYSKIELWDAAVDGSVALSIAGNVLSGLAGKVAFNGQ